MGFLDDLEETGGGLAIADMLEAAPASHPSVRDGGHTRTRHGGPMAAAQAAAGLTSKQKAAIVVRLLVSQQVSPGLDRLKPDVQIDLARTMAALGPVSRATLAGVLEEFTSLLDGLALTSAAGLDEALRLLEPHISPIARDHLRAEADRRDQSDPWGRLANMEPERLAPLLMQESAEVCAVMLSKLGVAKAAALLKDLPADRAQTIAHAVSLTATISPKTVARIGQHLVGQVQMQPVSAFGASAVDRMGAMLNAMPGQTRDSLLEGLEARDADFAGEVRRAIFTFAHIPKRVEATDVPRILRQVEPDQLTLALAAGMEAAPLSVEFILENMSKRLAEQMREEVEAAGKPREEEGDMAMAAVIAAIRDLEERGELRLIPVTD
jgi:flagellar motor switch protein FliG